MNNSCFDLYPAMDELSIYPSFWILTCPPQEIRLKQYSLVLNRTFGEPLNTGKYRFRIKERTLNRVLCTFLKKPFLQSQ